MRITGALLTLATLPYIAGCYSTAYTQAYLPHTPQSALCHSECDRSTTGDGEMLACLETCPRVLFDNEQCYPDDDGEPYYTCYADRSVNLGRTAIGTAIALAAIWGGTYLLLGWVLDGADFEP